MRQIQPIEHCNQRILTTQQLAEFYGTNAQTIYRNFHNNKDRHTAGKHYFYLEGEELKTFLHLQNLEVQNNSKIRSLYLWTEKGALLHAKSLNTDLAWEKYDWLVDEYYRQKEQLVLSDTLITALLDKLNHLPKGLSFVEVDLASLLATHLKRFMKETRSLLEQKDLPTKERQKLLQILSAIDQDAERYFAITEKLCELDQALLSALLAYRRILPGLSETKPLE